ncbi:Glyoxalase domain-containing protein 5 [Porphyridium purpureum]|uniref:Glyoxalase domain-containing protein 5 n=1 Tax=Porphyridium purpureum TaxID=35688 RepID=A0A5J4Z6W1_PORPP|nr:Glyoxalase domain-containing protein 5 [Porphyridium purpureum]|eukprot:POR4671..scf295_1
MGVACAAWTGVHVPRTCLAVQAASVRRCEREREAGISYLKHPARCSYRGDVDVVRARSTGSGRKGVTMAAAEQTGSEQKKYVNAALDHVAINVKDAAAMVDWYESVLELEPVDLDAFLSKARPFPSVRLNECTILDFFPPSESDGDGADGDSAAKGNDAMNHLCMSLNRTDFDRIVANARARGVHFDQEHPVSRSGAMGTGNSVYLRDLEKNVIELRYYE